MSCARCGPSPHRCARARSCGLISTGAILILSRSFGRRRGWGGGGARRLPMVSDPAADGQSGWIEAGRQPCQRERGQHEAEVS